MRKAGPFLTLYYLTGLMLSVLLSPVITFAQTSKKPALAGITLATYRQEAMKTFYEEVFSIKFRTGELEGYTLFNGKLGDMDFQLCPAALAQNNTDQNRHQLSIAVSDLQQTVENVHKHGGKSISGISLTEGRLTASVMDPDSNSIVLMQHSLFTDRAYFKATGTEPFWTLEINRDFIRFTSLAEGFDVLTTPHAEPVRAQDANVKMYRTTTEAVSIQAEIMQEECINAMSGKTSPYTVMVSVKHTAEEDFRTFRGCGDYLPDYRLRDIWVLDSLNGNKSTPEQYNGELPNMEINVRNKTFSGFAGCNRMNGRIFSENELLRFTGISTTRMACPGNNLEGAFLKALGAVTRWEISNNRLRLINPSVTLLVFRKAD